MKRDDGSIGFEPDDLPRTLILIMIGSGVLDRAITQAEAFVWSLNARETSGVHPLALPHHADRRSRRPAPGAVESPPLCRLPSSLALCAFREARVSEIRDITVPIVPSRYSFVSKNS